MASTVFATVNTPGPPGPAGPPGSSPIWLVAAGVPSNLVGNNGDMYLNNSTGTGSGDVYGPKANNVWGSPTANIRGSTGATGATGPAGYSPTYIVQPSPPTVGQGNPGDMAINSATSDLYGPKTTVWGPIVANLRGQTGAQGPPGVGYNPMGAWVSTTPYSQGDQVTSGNSLYISLQSANLNHPPATSPTWWQPVGQGSQTPWITNIDGGGFSLGNVGAIGVGALAAVNMSLTSRRTTASSFDISLGNTNPTGSTGITTTNDTLDQLQFGLGGSNVGATALRRNTFLLTSQDLLFGPGFAERMRITASGNVAIGNSGAALPDGDTANIHLIVGQTVAGSTFGEITTSANTTNTSFPAGILNFANYANAGAEKRIVAIAGYTDGAINSGATIFYNWNAGVVGESMRITRAGLVGIGTQTPLNLFQVHVAVNSNLAVRYDPATGNSVAIASFNDTGSAPGPLGFNCSSYAFMSGNVGIGNVAPWATLVVASPASVYPPPSLSFQTNAIWEAGITAGPGIALFNSGAPNYAMILQTRHQTVNANSWGLIFNPLGGNVGIGVAASSTPLKPLDIYSNLGGINDLLYLRSSIGIQGEGPAVLFGQNNNSALQARIQGAYSGAGMDLAFYNYASNTGSLDEHMRLTGQGQLGIGVKIPAGPFHVKTGTDLNIVFSQSGNISCILSQNDAVTANRQLLLVATGVRIGTTFSPPAYALDVAGDCNITGTYRINGAPISAGGGSQVYIATASSALTLSSTPADVPGAAVTMAVAGKYLILASFAFTAAGDATATAAGQLNAGGVLQTGTTGGWWPNATNQERGVVFQQWVYQATAGQVAKLQAYRSGTVGTVTTTTETTISAIWISP